MTSRNFCLVVPSLKAGGMERVASTIANHLADNEDCLVYLITLSQSVPFFMLSSRVRVLTINVARSSGYFGILGGLHKLRRTIRSCAPRAVISFGSMYNSYVLASLLGTNIPVFVSDRSNPYRNSRFTWRRDSIRRHDGFMHFALRRLLYPRAAGVLAQTRLAQKIELETWGQSARVIYFPNPVEVNKLSRLRQRENIILNVGRLIPSKNQKELLEIVAELPMDDWRLIFAGDGPDKNALEEYSRQLGIESRVRFLGNVENVRELMQRAKIFAFTSLSEGFPNALAEAMAEGLAPVAYDCEAGPSDLIEDSVNGFLIPVGDQVMFAERLTKLFQCEADRLRISESAHMSIEKFSCARIIQGLVREIDS